MTSFAIEMSKLKDFVSSIRKVGMSTYNINEVDQTLISIRGNEVSFVGTNGSSFIVRKHETEVEGEKEFGVFVFTSDLFEITKGTSNWFKFEVDDSIIKVTGQDNSIVELSLGDSDQALYNFEPDKGKKIRTLNGNALYKALAFVSSIKTDASMSSINVINITEGQIICTDGHRLHMAEIENGFSCLADPSPLHALIPILKKNPDSLVSVYQNKKQSTFTISMGDTDIVLSNKRKRDFPDIEKVLVKSKFIYDVSCESLLKALKHLKPHTGDINSIGIKFSDSILFQSVKKNTRADYSLFISRITTMPDKPIFLTINRDYLYDAVKQFPPDSFLSLGVTDATTAIRLHNYGGMTAIIMPTRLNKTPE
jgi:DNA polymerase III sliding clamp (beta) subunit (PCNA family)